jgi:hypothetical protein
MNTVRRMKGIHLPEEIGYFNGSDFGRRNTQFYVYMFEL